MQDPPGRLEQIRSVESAELGRLWGVIPGGLVVVGLGGLVCGLGELDDRLGGPEYRLGGLYDELVWPDEDGVLDGLNDVVLEAEDGVLDGLNDVVLEAEG